MSLVQQFPLLRGTLETLARGCRIKRRLPNGEVFYVTPDSQLKYLGRTFDADLIDLARTRVTPDSVVWDVGANCGVLAFSSSSARQVVAVEADPFLGNLIQESAALNGAPVVLVSAAASSNTGLAEFSIARRGRASNHLASVTGNSQAGGERARILVPTVTLDQLLDAVLPPTLVKIDVEGAEVEVLKGATRLLRECRPVLYLETGRDTHEECARILTAAGYTLTKGAELNWLCAPKEHDGRAELLAAE